MFDYSVLTQAPMNETPYRWAQIKGFFPAGYAEQLSREYPLEGFTASIGRSGHYQNEVRQVVDDGRILAIDHMSSAWIAIIHTFASPEYRAAMERLTKLDLSNCELKVRLVRYMPGDWMGPHTDQQDRAMTQIIYLTQNWDPAWGGALQILRSAAPDDLVADLPPAFNTSALFVRSDNSWHAVAPLLDAARDTRRTILVQFIRKPANA